MVPYGFDELKIQQVKTRQIAKTAKKAKKSFFVRTILEIVLAKLGKLDETK
jgi:hypothetical protein